jgi:uncharacterized coiled-coil DUF342 family protein
MQLIPKYFISEPEMAEYCFRSFDAEVPFSRLVAAAQTNLKNAPKVLKKSGRLAPQALFLFEDPGFLKGQRTLHGPLLEFVKEQERMLTRMESQYSLDLKCLHADGFGVPHETYINAINDVFPSFKQLVINPLFDYKILRILGRAAMQTKMVCAFEQEARGNLIRFWLLNYSLWCLGKPLAALAIACNEDLRRIYDVSDPSQLLKDADVFLEGFDPSDISDVYLTYLSAHRKGVEWFIRQMQQQPLMVAEITIPDVIGHLAFQAQHLNESWASQMVQSAGKFSYELGAVVEISEDLQAKFEELFNLSFEWNSFEDVVENCRLLNAIDTIRKKLVEEAQSRLTSLDDLANLRKRFAEISERIASGKNSDGDLDQLPKLTAELKAAQGKNRETIQRIKKCLDDVMGLINGTAELYSEAEDEQWCRIRVRPKKQAKPAGRAAAAAAAEADPTAKLKAQIESLRHLQDARDAEAAELVEKLADTRAELETQRAKAASLEASLRALRAGTTITPAVDPQVFIDVATSDAPSAVNVLKVIEAIFPDSIEVTTSAYSSAAEQVGFNLGQRMLDLLIKLADQYVPVYLNQGDNEAHKVFGHSYSAQESETVMAGERTRSQRVWVYDNEEREFIKHLRVSNQTGKAGMRIYFEVIGEKAVIAYAGEHLEVASSS